MTDEGYDPSAPDQHAQFLFDSAAKQGELPALYKWLSARNIDANVVPHDEIRRLAREESARELLVDDGPRMATDACSALEG